MIPIYQCEDLYLYEIVEDFKWAETEEERADILNAFCASIWSCANKRRTWTRTIRYRVNRTAADSELGRIFAGWTRVEYLACKSTTKEENWRPLLRQKINNLYTRYFDPEIILDKAYLDLLKTPKRLYYEWTAGAEMDPADVEAQISRAMEEAGTVKKALQRGKMTLPWNDYKRLIETFLYRCFQNCKLADQYEGKACVLGRVDFLTEDHFYVKYMSRCLDGELRKWQKQYYGVPQSSRKGYKRCAVCAALIEKGGNRKTLCRACRADNDLMRYRRYNEKRTTNRKTEF